jgi:ribosomal protein S25
MQQNSSQWLRRMREKHRRIAGINKLFHPGEVNVQQETSPKKGMRDTNVIVMEERRPYGDLRRFSEDQRNTSQDLRNTSQDQGESSQDRGNTPSIAELEADVWELRKQFILKIANRRNGKIKLLEVATECNVNIRIAAEWLLRLSKEGILSLVAGQRNTMTYLVKEVGREQK